MNPYNPLGQNYSKTTTTYRVNPHQNAEYVRGYTPEKKITYKYTQPNGYRGNSQTQSSSNRRVRSVNVNRPQQRGNSQVKYANAHPSRNTQQGLDQISKNLVQSRNHSRRRDNNSFVPNVQRPASIRSGNQNNRRYPSIPKKSNVYNNYTTPIRNNFNAGIQTNPLKKTVSRKSPENFISNPTDTKYRKPSEKKQQMIGLTLSERNNNTEIYTSQIQTSQLLNIKPNTTTRNGAFEQQEYSKGKFNERNVKYQSIIPGSNANPSNKNSNFINDSYHTRNRLSNYSRNTRPQRNDSSGRIKGNAFINIPKVKTDYGIMNTKSKHSNNDRNYAKRNKHYDQSKEPLGPDNLGYPSQGFKPKFRESNEILSGYNSAEKNTKINELREYEKTINQIDSNKLFKNNYRIEKNQKLDLNDDIFDKSRDYFQTISVNQKNRQNASRSRSRLANMNLIGKSVDKKQAESGEHKKRALDPFSYKYNVSPKPQKKEAVKQRQAGYNQMMSQMNKYSETAITFDPIIEKKVRALPKEKVEKALFQSNKIKSIDELKDKIMKKNEILMSLKAQHMKLVQDPKNPDNLRSQLQMREKQNKKILEKIKRIREQTEQKKEEYKELIEIDNQMKTLLSMMSESEKRERDRLIAELKRTDELYLKTKMENEQLKEQMEDSSKGMVFKQHLIDEEVNRVKSMIEETMEEDDEKGNQMLIDQIKKMYNKLLAAKN